MKFPDLVDKVYEASVLPELWEGLLIEMCDAVDAKLGTVFTSCTTNVTSIVTPGAEEVLKEYAEGNWDSANSRLRRGRKLNHAGFVTDFDMFTQEEISKDPFYNGYLLPQGLGWCAGTEVVTPTEDVLVMSFDRGVDRGPFAKETVAWLDSLRPHLARSLTMTARLKEQVAAQITDTLGAFGLPACLVDSRGRMKVGNALLSPLIPTLIADRRDRVALRHLPSDQLLAGALSRAGSRHEVMSIPMPPIDDIPACVIHIVPVAGRGRDIFPNGFNILAVAFAGSSSLPNAPILRGLFDLTPAEAKVASCIASGMSPINAAAEVGMSPNTVKHHLKSVYDKTGVDHYGALVRMLCGMGLEQVPSGVTRLP